jgi:hypothetical protein
VLVQTTTTSWPTPRLLAAGIAPIIIGLSVLVVSGWTSPPSLAQFLIGAAVAGAGIGAIIRGSLTVVITIAGPDDRAGVTTDFRLGRCHRDPCRHPHARPPGSTSSAMSWIGQRPDDGAMPRFR